ncbi:MAG: DNA polymerase [Actinomycetes bacterium]
MIGLDGCVRVVVPLPEGRTWVADHEAGTDGAASGHVLPAADLATEVAQLPARWVWWCAADLRHLAGPLRGAKCWDLTAVHGLRTGRRADDRADDRADGRGDGRADDTAHRHEEVLAAATGRAPRPVVPDGQLDLAGEPADGEAAALPTFAKDPNDAARLAAAGLLTYQRQLASRTAGPGGDAAAALTDASESAAALLAVELESTGLPVHLPTARALLAAQLGPEPPSEAAAAEQRRRRDEAVLTLLPRAADSEVHGADLRSPAVVRELLAAVGVVVPDTRSWRLEAYRNAHPFVAALLAWRKAERLATTYGYRWLEACVSDGRLRGRWSVFDGGAGRMTASSGLHNLPAELRPAVRAEAGHVLVRADLGQVEPRVLAVVSRDPALGAACADADLYAPVAARLGCDRARAKIAVLAAMYGQRSGTAGQALAAMERSYPTALATLQAAEDVGASGGSLRTYGGRLVGAVAGSREVSWPGRGRFLRNALIQGSAAELFKIWAVTVRAALAAQAPAAEIVLCLHDELLVHAPAADAQLVAEVLRASLADASRWWCPDFPVRFTADVSVADTWAKDAVVQHPAV